MLISFNISGFFIDILTFFIIINHFTINY